VAGRARRGLAVRRCPLGRRTLFNIGYGAHWLPATLLHPGTWPTFTILRAIRRLAPPDLSARQFIERRGYRGRARTLAELTLTAHLPGSSDEIGMLGLLEDRVLDLESGLNHRVADGYDRLPQRIAAGLDIALGVVVRRIEWRADGVSVGDAPPVLIAYCTGPSAAAMGALGDGEAAAVAVQDLRRHFPGAAPRLIAHRRIDWGADPFARGGYTFVRPGGTGARAPGGGGYRRVVLGRVGGRNRHHRRLRAGRVRERITGGRAGARPPGRAAMTPHGASAAITGGQAATSSLRGGSRLPLPCARPGVHHQHAARRAAHDALGNAAHQHVRQAAASVGRHDHEIGLQLPGHVDDRLVRRAKALQRARLDPPGPQIRRQPGQLLLAGAFHLAGEDPGVVADPVAVGRGIVDRLDDVQNDDLRSVRTREIDRIVERLQ
jgi:hypothetical protein